MTVGDRVVLGLALTLIVWLYARFWGGGAAGDHIQVLVAGRPYQQEDLRRNGRLTIAGVIGPSEIEIRDGRVRFVSSPCRGKQCIHSGWLARDGDFAACLPNGIAVQVVGANARFDAISF